MGKSVEECRWCRWRRDNNISRCESESCASYSQHNMTCGWTALKTLGCGQWTNFLPVWLFKNSKPKKSFNCWSVTVIYNNQIQALLFCYLQVFLVFIRGPGYLFFYYLMTTDGVLNGYFILTNLTNFKLFTEISGTFYALFWFWSGRDLALKMLRSWISVY